MFSIDFNDETAKDEKPNSLTALANITNLKKLCNHPELVHDKIIDGTDGFANTVKFLPEGYSKKYFLFIQFINCSFSNFNNLQRTSPRNERKVNVIGHDVGQYTNKYNRQDRFGFELYTNIGYV